MIMLKEGIKAPNFTSTNQFGEEVKLSDYLGYNVVLYFYSKDMTSGCTKEATAFRDLYPFFKEKDTVIIGVSKDTTISHKKFMDKYSLPFILLSDPELEVIKMYDVLGEKNMYGKKVIGVIRSTYIINKEGTIQKAFTKVKAEENPKEVLDCLCL